MESEPQRLKPDQFCKAELARLEVVPFPVGGHRRSRRAVGKKIKGSGQEYRPRAKEL